jgi:hypothetical protein
VRLAGSRKAATSYELQRSCEEEYLKKQKNRTSIH